MEECGDQGSKTLDLGEKTIQLLKWSQVTIVWKLSFAEQYPAYLNGKGSITEMQHLPSVHNYIR